MELPFWMPEMTVSPVFLYKGKAHGVYSPFSENTGEYVSAWRCCALVRPINSCQEAASLESVRSLTLRKTANCGIEGIRPGFSPLLPLVSGGANWNS